MSGHRCVTVSLWPLFRLGQVCATPAALKSLEAGGVDPITLLARHVRLDGGDLCDEDQEQNRVAVQQGLRVFSSYRVGTGLAEERVWCITEWNRSLTTILTPDDY